MSTERIGELLEQLSELMVEASGRASESKLRDTIDALHNQYMSNPRAEGPVRALMRATASAMTTGKRRAIGPDTPGIEMLEQLGLVQRDPNYYITRFGVRVGAGLRGRKGLRLGRGR